MTHSGPTPDTDLTIAELTSTGRRLGIRCDSCGRFRYMNAARFDPDRKVSDLSKDLSCSQCGSRDVRAVAVSRDPKTGFWPAEHS